MRRIILGIAMFLTSLWGPMELRAESAGASAPEVLVEDVIEALRKLGPVDVTTLEGREENIQFRLPAELAAV